MQKNAKVQLASRIDGIDGSNWVGLQVGERLPDGGNGATPDTGVAAVAAGGERWPGLAGLPHRPNNAQHGPLLRLTPPCPTSGFIPPLSCNARTACHRGNRHAQGLI